MKPKFKLEQKVTVLAHGHADTGFVIGIEKYSAKTYVALVSAKQFLTLLDTFRYKVVYERGNRLKEWQFLETELSN